ncbi:MAG TPA: glycosyltransferase family 39 protein [Terracidiphilus sp.]
MPSSSSPHMELEARSPRKTLASGLASPWFQVLFVAVVATLLYLFRLGTGALLDWDEATYAQISREMSVSGNWLLPTWTHHPFFKKPPLIFWLQAGLFHCFGGSEFWARFPSAFAAVVVVVLVYIIARRLVSPSAGLFAAFSLMTMSHFDRAAREDMTDALLCVCIFLAIYAWLRLRRDSPGWFYLLCASIGIGAMIKGPAVLVAPIAIAADWLVTRNPGKVLPRRHYLFGTLLIFAIVAPWHIWMMVHFGYAFFHQYVDVELGRRVSTDFEGSTGGPFYYFRFIFYGAFPWSVVSLIALGEWIRARNWSHSLIWILAGIVLIGYSLVPTRHQWYIVPVYPAVAIEVGRLLAETSDRWRLVRYAGIAVLAGGMIIAFIHLDRRRGDLFTNQVAELAKAARGANHRGPLLVIPAPGTDSQLALPTAVFYSNRPAVFIAIPDDDGKLAHFVKTYNSMDAIIQDGAVSDLSKDYVIRLKAQNSSGNYAEISKR